MSGSGKTTVSLGLMASLKRRGLTVAPFKVGPDFIDPGHHFRVTGRVSWNLDDWMLSASYNLACFQRAAAGSDVCIVEGVMGLYDGYDGNSETGSTARMAKLLNLPVVMVIDAAGMARSAAALLQGFENFDRGLQFAGVIFNNVASPGHLETLTAAISENVKVPCFGGIPKDSHIAIPERHLGLVTDAEHPLSNGHIRQLSDLVDEHIDVTGLLSQLEDHNPEPVCDRDAARDRKVRIGVARDKAFCFYYQDNLDLLENAGAEIIHFSPVEDHHLPEGLGGIYFGGGYPELFAEALSKNRAMLHQIGEKSRLGMPIYAECGGFMYLCDSLTDPDGRKFKMAGCFSFQTKMSKKLKALGYREITLTADTVIGKNGLVIRGHEFHYSTMDTKPLDELQTVFNVSNGSAGGKHSGGYQIHNTLGSYHHLHFGNCPGAADGFAAACRLYRRKRRRECGRGK